MNYKIGSKGSAVVQIQKYVKVSSDGIYGQRTAEAVKQWQSAHNLDADGIVGPATWEAMFGSNINNKCIDGNIVYMPLGVHVTHCPNRQIKYLAIHFTAGSSSAKGRARNVKSVFESRPASADFCVDDCEMVQFNPDINNYYCWAVGDKKAQGSGGGQLYGIASNKNTISIEICSTCNPATSTAVSHSNHDGWSFTKEALDNAVKLAKIIMEKFNIPIERVVRHYDISGKLCPGIIGWNDAAEVYDKNTGKRIAGAKNNSSEWIKFKERLK